MGRKQMFVGIIIKLFNAQRLMLRMLMVVSLTGLILCNTGWSQTYPERMVRIVVGFGAGGPDTTARILADQLSSQTGQPFMVENRPGAGGSIGAEVVAKAKPDGYTLMVASSTFAFLPSAYKSLPFDVIRDFTPITQIGSFDAWILVASPSLPASNLKELIALARAPSSKIAYGSTGTGTTSHLTGAAFNAAAKTNMLHVPYKDMGAVTTAMMSGEVQIMFATPSQTVPLIKAGRLRALAYDHPTRAPFLPDVPTMAEAGGSETGIPPAAQYMFTTAKTPPETLARIEVEVRKAIATPQVRERLLKTSLNPVGNSLEECRKLFGKEVKGYAEAASAAGIKPQ